MGKLREELRRADYKDIQDEYEFILEFREIEFRHYYEPNFPSLLPLIKLCDKRLGRLIRNYEKNWGVRLKRKDL